MTVHEGEERLRGCSHSVSTCIPSDTITSAWLFERDRMWSDLTSPIYMQMYINGIVLLHK